MTTYEEALNIFHSLNDNGYIVQFGMTDGGRVITGAAVWTPSGEYAHMTIGEFANRYRQIAAEFDDRHETELA